MPENGLFRLRCMCAPPPPGSAVTVSLQYGLDVGVAGKTVQYDPEEHGPRVPGYQLLRLRSGDDEAAMKANRPLAERLRDEFVADVRASVPGFKVYYSRLSLGGKCIFMRHASEAGETVLEQAKSALARRHDVRVNLWQTGPRDEVAALGGVGPCGRACCCAGWLNRFPARIAPDRVRGLVGGVAAQNGICGRFKCCLSFEDE